MNPDSCAAAKPGLRCLVALTAMLMAGFAGATTVPAFTVTGRVAVSEPASCDGGGGDLTQNLVLSWTDCHAIKQHMDAAGQPITANAFVPTALRPLSLTVRIQVFCYYNGGSSRDVAPRAISSVQTDDTGSFTARVRQTTCGQAAGAEGIVTEATAALTYAVGRGKRRVGTIRALWDKTLGQTVYNSVLSGSEPVLYSSSGRNFVIPRFILGFSRLAFPLSPTLDLGNQTFFTGAIPGYYDYVRGAMGAWQTTVRLHRRLSATLEAEGYGALYGKMFISDPSAACTRCYTLRFDNRQGGGVGGAGSFNVDQPVRSPSLIAYGGLVSVGLPAHEFGHSMHATIASGSFSIQYAYDDSMHATQTPQGGVSADNTPYLIGNALQQQELGLAFTEGFGDAMGAYFLGGCRINDRAWGNPDPLQNMWNTQNFQSCDGSPGCPYGAFRYQMSRRGIGENSPAWNARLASLGNLAQQAAAAGATMVLSNNDLKMRSFFCDLLDSDPDVSFAAGQIGGKSYIADYTWHAAERLDGRTPAVTVRTFASDPAPEQVSIGLGRLLSAMDAFAPGLQQVPLPLWRSPAITDGANKPYNDARISVNGVLSPQSLGRYLVNRGDLTKDQLNNILRSNRMDEVP
jgi:hypothetical protein